jgi:hypothetical protein
VPWISAEKLIRQQNRRDQINEEQCSLIGRDEGWPSCQWYADKWYHRHEDEQRNDSNRHRSQPLGARGTCGRQGSGELMSSPIGTHGQLIGSAWRDPIPERLYRKRFRGQGAPKLSRIYNSLSRRMTTCRYPGDKALPTREQVPFIAAGLGNGFAGPCLRAILDNWITPFWSPGSRERPLHIAHEQQWRCDCRIDESEDTIKRDVIKIDLNHNGPSLTPYFDHR